MIKYKNLSLARKISFRKRNPNISQKRIRFIEGLIDRISEPVVMALNDLDKLTHNVILTPGTWEVVEIINPHKSPSLAPRAE